jgi:hypothetical protein
MSILPESLHGLGETRAKSPASGPPAMGLSKRPYPRKYGKCGYGLTMAVHEDILQHGGAFRVDKKFPTETNNQNYEVLFLFIAHNVTLQQNR